MEAPKRGSGTLCVHEVKNSCASGGAVQNKMIASDEGFEKRAPE
jgi:hypothetical protein